MAEGVGEKAHEEREGQKRQRTIEQDLFEVETRKQPVRAEGQQDGTRDRIDDAREQDAEGRNEDMSHPETAREAEGKHELGNPDEVSETPVGSLAQGEYIQRDNRGDEADFQCNEQAPEDEGKRQLAGVGMPGGVTTERVIVDNMGTEEKECLLYLPLYDELKSLEIGVSSDAHIYKGENPFKKKIVVYGSSILQGASASRPGMAYPARLSRSSGYNFINLGLSGNGKMEKEVAGMLANIDADAFILDCIPNPSPKEITERAVGFVMTLREKHPDTPIIIIQT